MWLLAMCLAPEDSQRLFQAYEKAECSPAAGIPICLDTMQHKLSTIEEDHCLCWRAGISQLAEDTASRSSGTAAAKVS